MRRTRPLVAALAAATTALLTAGAGHAVAQETDAGTAATPEAVQALFPDMVAGMERSSIRGEYNSDGYAAVEAEYGAGSEGPVGGGRSGVGISLHAGLEDPGDGPIESLLERVRSRGGATDTTYMGHRAHWLELGPGTRGAMVLTEGTPRAVALAVVQGDGAPSPGEALAALDVEALAALASSYRTPSFRTADERAEAGRRTRAEAGGEALTMTHPEGWTVQDLSGEMDHPYLLVSHEPVDRHLLVRATNRTSSPALGGNVVVQASVSFAQQGIADAMGRHGLPEHLFEDWEMVHDRRRVRVGGAEGMERRVEAVDPGGTAYRHRQLVFDRGGRLIFVQALVPSDADADVVAAVEAAIASIALEETSGGG